jgi:LacI family transcriptional regulator
VVLVDRTSDDGSLSSVSVDDVAGGRMAVEHLLERGRRSLAFVGPVGIRQSSDRLEGARAAAAAAGARLEVIEADEMSVAAGRAAGAALLDRAIADRPDGVFAVNDLVSMGILQSLLREGSGVTVPGDVALIGYDDIDFASAAVVPLSSIRQPSALIGRTALEVLLDEAADPGLERRQIVFQPELLARASTG